MSASDQRVDVMILAGDRRADDPLLEKTQVVGKALIALGERPLLERVLTEVRDWPKIGKIVLVAPQTKPYQEVVEAATITADQLVWLAPRETLHLSITAALNAPNCFIDRGALVTGDHGLLRSQWLDAVVNAVDGGADLALALADHQQVMAAFPNSQRTRYRFRDQSICGGNVFSFRCPEIHQVLNIWAAVESERKKPWKMLSAIGVSNVVRYLSGRLRLNEAFLVLSNKTKVNVVPVVLDDPCVAVDIDSLEDLMLAEQALLQRQKANSSC